MMKRWEYSFIQVSANDPERMSTLLDRVGSEGWEAFSTVLIPTGTANDIIRVFVKKELPPE